MSIWEKINGAKREQREAEKAYEAARQQAERQRVQEALRAQEAARIQREREAQQRLQVLHKSGTIDSMLELKRGLPLFTRSKLEVDQENGRASLRFGSGNNQSIIEVGVGSRGLSINGTDIPDWQENPDSVQDVLIKAYLNPRHYVPLYKPPRFSGSGRRGGDGDDRPLDQRCCHCLSKGSIISTPSGEVKVEDLKAGDFVWTTNSTGKRIKSKIIKITKILVQRDHMMLKVTTIDNKTITVSPEHPDKNGLPLITALQNLNLNEVKIKNVELIRYENRFTYDILPEGETGSYWVNGILLGSTLSSKFQHSLAHTI